MKQLTYMLRNILRKHNSVTALRYNITFLTLENTKLYLNKALVVLRFGFVLLCQSSPQQLARKYFQTFNSDKTLNKLHFRIKKANQVNHASAQQVQTYKCLD